MSMYTHLLDAAYERRPVVSPRPSAHNAVSAVRRCRGELELERPAAPGPDAVPIVLAREIGYDVALLELAEVLGVETDPSRFEQPLDERARLERAFLDRGIVLQAPGARAGTAARPT